MKNNKVTRRKFLPFLGGGLLLPFIGFAKNVDSGDEEYETLLTADGKTVKVRKDNLKESKVLEQEMSDRSLLKWLKPRR